MARGNSIVHKLRESIVDPVQALINFASTLAIAFYYGGILALGVDDWRGSLNPEAIPYISGVVTGIGGTLATFFGAIVGLNRANAHLQNVAGAGAQLQVTDLSRLQIAAAWAYFLSLALACGLWVWSGFSKEMAEAVRNLALTLPGVIAGILAVALNVQKP